MSPLAKTLLAEGRASPDALVRQTAEFLERG
jgi:hypothetical protein